MPFNLRDLLLGYSECCTSNGTIQLPEDLKDVRKEDNAIMCNVPHTNAGVVS